MIQDSHRNEIHLRRFSVFWFQNFSHLKFHLKSAIATFLPGTESWPNELLTPRLIIDSVYIFREELQIKNPLTCLKPYKRITADMTLGDDVNVVEDSTVISSCILHVRMYVSMFPVPILFIFMSGSKNYTFVGKHDV